MRFASTRQVFNAASADLADQASHDDRGQREGIEAIAVETRPDRTVNPRDLWTGQPTRRTFLGGMFAAAGAGAVVPPDAAASTVPVVEPVAPTVWKKGPLVRAWDDHVCAQYDINRIAARRDTPWQERALKICMDREEAARGKLVNRIAAAAGLDLATVPDRQDERWEYADRPVATTFEDGHLFVLVLAEPSSYGAVNLHLDLPANRRGAVRPIVFDLESALKTALKVKS